MPRLDERRIRRKDTCYHCEHCYPFEVYWEGEAVRTNELFCMLDVSDEDIEYVLDEEPLNNEGERPVKLLEIMQIADDEDLCDSRRMMGPTSCCQFFERNEE